MFFKFEFITIWIIALILYYSICKKLQWEILLAISVVFIYLNVTGFPWVLLIVFFITYTTAVWIWCTRKSVIKKEKTIKTIRVISNTICIIVMLFARTSGLLSLFGNSYFTLKAVGYIIDVDNDEDKCERNPFFTGAGWL